MRREDRPLTAMGVYGPWLAKRGDPPQRVAVRRLMEGGFTSRTPGGSCGKFAAQHLWVLGENGLCESLQEARVHLHTQI